VLASTVAAAVIVVAVVVAIGWSKNAAKQRENARLLELRSAEVLASSIEELFPADPAHVGKMQRWLDGVDAVLAKAPGYRAELAAAQAAGDDATSELLAAPVRAMERLAGSLRPEVEKWRAQAADLVRVSLTVDAAKWREAIDDVAALAVYGGLEMKEQLGLVPLRVDPASGLWEFWHVLSGERPLPDPASPSGYRVTPAMGIVLVLLPGGTTTLGSPADEPDRDNTNEPLAHEVTLEPSFLAKFEVTQAQWLRVMGDRPSLYGPGARILAADRPSGAPPDDADVHPVESVNWETCSRFLHRVGLRLPGEDEWERGARAGTTTSYWWEAEAGSSSPRGFENTADASCKRRTSVGFVDYDDGYAAHAPVGSFRPNPFGLFDMGGNVGEWCAEWFRNDVPPDDVERRRLVRGGTWFARPTMMRSSVRQWDNPLALNQARGLRAARSLDR
jgi:formylglycine-generating enzyme required for sulfatase activity